MWKVYPFLISPLLCTLSWRYFLWISILFSLIMLKDLKELLVVLVTFALQQTTNKKFKTNKQTNKQTNKRHNLMIQSLLSNNTSIVLSLLWLRHVRKTCCLYRKNGTITHTFRKTKDCRQQPLVIYTKWALK